MIPLAIVEVWAAYGALQPREQFDKLAFYAYDQPREQWGSLAVVRQPSIDQRQRFFGVGTVRPDPREAMIDAAELTARLIRSFMSRGSDSFDPLPFLTVAERHATPLGAGDTLHLFVVPWPAPIEPPPGWLAIFAASTRRWKRGQAPLIQTLDAFVDAFVRRRHWPLEQIAIKRYDHTEPHLFFSHQVVVMRPSDIAPQR